MRKFFLPILILLTACAPTQSGIARTPIPSLIPATLPAPKVLPLQISYGTGECKIPALDLISAWVKAGKPEENAFPFKASDNSSCQATYLKDVQPLFHEPNIWFPGAIACVTCHGEDVTKSPGGLSLVDYQNIVSGSRRKALTDKGNDILGDENTWEKSKLYIQILTRQMPVGRPQTSPEKGPVINTGQIIP
jgi:hypothetical protein